MKSLWATFRLQLETKTLSPPTPPLGCHNHSSSLSSSFSSPRLVRSLFITVHICAMWDWCMCLMAANCKNTCIKSEGSSSSDRLRFSSHLCFACTSSLSLPRMPASVISEQPLPGDGSVNDILSRKVNNLPHPSPTVLFLFFFCLHCCHRLLFKFFLASHCMFLQHDHQRHETQAAENTKKHKHTNI